MIPIPSLLLLEECYPQNNDDVVVKEENTADTDKDDQDSMKEIQCRRRRRRRRQQQQSPSTTNRLSQPSVPLRLRRIIEIEPQRRRLYDYDQFSNPRTRFWELQQHEERQQQSQHNNNNKSQGKLVVSIHRKSQLCIFLFTLIPFILVDEWSLLPAGTIFYIAALSIAWENWMNELEQDQLFIQQLKYQRQKRNKFYHEIENAKFEYHILKNKPNIDIKVIINERGNNDKNEKNSKNNNFDPKWTIYADERRH
jgi:hypothetical protein